MTTLYQDIETKSSTDIGAGVARYAEDRDFAVTLHGYAIDDGPVTVIDTAAGEPYPAEFLEALRDPAVIKSAWNAAFERTCLARHGLVVPIEQWRCTMALALTLGLPGALGEAAKVLKLDQDKQKMAIGKKLIRKFCIPQKRRKTGELYWIAPMDLPEEWKLFKEYCGQDVVVEREIRQKLLRYDMPDVEYRTYWLDQKINDRGLLLDLKLVDQALVADAVTKARFEQEAIVLTGLANPNSVAQLKEWLQDETFTEIEALNKETLLALLKGTNDATVRRVLELRQELSKTSVKKYKAMENMVCRDGRVRGLLQYYGANRTGRWAGRGVQIQNLTKSSLKLSDLDNVRELLKAGKFKHIETLYGSVPDILSQLIRTAFIAPHGKTFAVIDFSAIEARMLAWLANESWRMDVFNSHGKIYEASASEMFKVPIEEITKGNPLRQKGKISELALGYGGSEGALVTMGGLKMGLTEDELMPLVRAWRAANPAVVQFWWDIGDAAMETVRNKTTTSVAVGLPDRLAHPIVFSYESGFMFITLPSGRRLAYVRPRIEMDQRFNRETITYEGMNQVTKRWERINTYGPKLVENICQAACRDLLRDTMLEMDALEYPLVAHVHDEVIVEVPNDSWLAPLEVIMGKSSVWAPELPLKGDGFTSNYYRKGD